MHQPVFLERMHLSRLGLARLEEAQRLGIGTWKTMVWPPLSGASGMRWRVWMMVALPVSVVTATLATF